MELKNLIAKQKKNSCIMATKDLAFLPIANVLISFFASRFFCFGVFILFTFFFNDPAAYFPALMQYTWR